MVKHLQQVVISTPEGGEAPPGGQQQQQLAGPEGGEAPPAGGNQTAAGGEAPRRTTATAISRSSRW